MTNEIESLTTDMHARRTGSGLSPMLFAVGGLALLLAAHAHWRGVRSSLAHGALNFSHYFGRMAGCAHPAGARHLAHTIHFDLQHTHRIQQWRHLAFVDAFGVFGIQVAGRIFAVVFGRGRFGC